MKLRQNTTIPSLSALGQGDFLHHTKKRSIKANRAQPKSFVRHYYSNTTDHISEIFDTSQSVLSKRKIVHGKHTDSRSEGLRSEGAVHVNRVLSDAVHYQT